MTRRLLISYLGLALILLAVLEIPLAIVAARHDRGLAAQAVEREATGLAVFASSDLEAGRQASLQTLATSYKNRTGGEVSVVDSAGVVVASSDTDHDGDTGADSYGGQLAAIALSGRPADNFGTDEGEPWAEAAVPISVGGQPGGAVLLGVPAEATEARIHGIWLELGLFGVGLIGLTTVLGVGLARSVTRPLGRLELTVSQFAGGDLSARAPVVGPAELRALAEQFNLMAIRIEELIGAQTRFVADASHQLRSPLTALRLRLENLEADIGDPASGAAAAGIAAAGQEVQRLSRIVDGLLTLGRAEGEAPAKQPVDVVEVIEQRCDSWAALAGERRIVLDRRPDALARAVVPLVPGDLDQMIDNLLANALDALDAGGTVTVHLLAGPGRQVAVHVTDDGPGMTAEDRERAFNRFWQGPGARGGHSGLGLAIVRQLADRNGAEVALRQAEPQGLDAVILLPPGTIAPSTRTPAGPSARQANAKERQKMLS